MTGADVAKLLEETAAWIQAGREGLPPSLAALPDGERDVVVWEIAGLLDGLETRLGGKD
jgi:hypothetical protein